MRPKWRASPSTPQHHCSALHPTALHSTAPLACALPTGECMPTGGTHSQGCQPVHPATKSSAALQLPTTMDLDAQILGAHSSGCQSPAAHSSCCSSCHTCRSPPTTSPCPWPEQAHHGLHTRSPGSAIVPMKHDGSTIHFLLHPSSPTPTDLLPPYCTGTAVWQLPGKTSTSHHGKQRH